MSENWIAKYVNLKNALSAGITTLIILMIKAIEAGAMDKASMYLNPFFWVLGIAYLLITLLDYVPAVADWWIKNIRVVKLK